MGHPLYIPPGCANKVTVQELLDLFESNIVEKHVVANQPILRGGFKCDDHCDTENHHTHQYCTFCKQNLLNGTIVHTCKWGYTPGMEHPGMNPDYLINNPWWNEPLPVQRYNYYVTMKLFASLKLLDPITEMPTYPAGVAADLD